MDRKTIIAKFLLKALLVAAFFELIFFLNYYLISKNGTSSAPSLTGSLPGIVPAAGINLSGSSAAQFFGSVLSVNGKSVSVEGTPALTEADKLSVSSGKEKRDFDLSSAKIFIQGEKKSAPATKTAKSTVSGSSYPYVLNESGISAVGAGDMVLVSALSSSVSGPYKAFRLIIVSKAAK